MLVLETICHETLWGGPRLTPLSGTVCTKIGHLYSVLSRNGISNRILNAPYGGKTLNEVFGLWKRTGLDVLMHAVSSRHESEKMLTVPDSDSMMLRNH